MAKIGIATSGQSRSQKEEKDCCRRSRETTTRLGKDGSGNPQAGVTGRNLIQKIRN
jgi:hypothetical protein